MENRLETLRQYIDDVLQSMPDIFDRRCAYLHLYGVAQACALIALKRGEDVELATMAGRLIPTMCNNDKNKPLRTNGIFTGFASCYAVLIFLSFSNLQT